MAGSSQPDWAAGHLARALADPDRFGWERSAYRRRKAGLWLLSGLLYGLTFYTYLAARITPVLLVALAVFLILTGRGRNLWPGTAWFILGSLLVAPSTPVADRAAARPDSGPVQPGLDISSRCQ